MHHAYTEDEYKDPYLQVGVSEPHALDSLPRSEFFDQEVYKKYAPDLARDPFYRWLDRYLLLQIP